MRKITILGHTNQSLAPECPIMPVHSTQAQAQAATETETEAEAEAEAS